MHDGTAESEVLRLGKIKKFFRDIEHGTVLNLLVKSLSAFGLGFAAYYFKVQGVEFYKIILIWAISPLVSLPVVVAFNKWDIKKFLRIGLLAHTGMAFSLFFFSSYSFLLYGFFDGLRLGIFCVALNYVFFLKSSHGNHAKNSSVYFIISPLVGIALPPLGALLIDGLGFRALFFITGLLSFLPLLYVRGEGFDFVEKVSWRQADKAFSGFRLITFFDAALHFFQGNFLTIYALLFLSTEFQVGGLLSYLALISLFASFIVAHISDKSKKRVTILYPLLIAMSVLIMVIPAIKSLAVLIPVIGIYAIFDNLTLPVRFAIPMDFVKMDIGFWRASEFYGNVGRTVVFAISALLLYLGNKWIPFAIFAAMTLAFPFIISYKTKGLRRTPS